MSTAAPHGARGQRDGGGERDVQVSIDRESAGVRLPGLLGVPTDAPGIVVFCHGSGSGRLSGRNRFVADRLRARGLGTLLFDLLTEREGEDRNLVFDISTLGERARGAAAWLREQPGMGAMPIGLFGASTGAAAALLAEARGAGVAAIVSRGGRPDLAEDALEIVRAPTLLIVGSLDHACIPLNRDSFERLKCEKDFEVVPGAGHLFEEPGTLERVAELAGAWFERWFGMARGRAGAPLMFRDRIDAGRRLGEALGHLRVEAPVVIALPRGGVVVGREIARALDAPLDVLIVRKIGAPNQPELAIGAVSNGDPIHRVVDRQTMRAVGVDEQEMERLVRAQIEEIHRRETLYRAGREPIVLKGRAVIVVDDGIATGSTLIAGLRSLRDRGVGRIVVAVPCAPRQVIPRVRTLADEVVCLETPDPFRAVGLCYADFDQVSDEQVVRILREMG